MGVLKKIKNVWLRASINEDNSSLTVKCVAPGKCEFRRTSICQMCGRNVDAMLQEKSYFVAKAGN